MTVFDRKTLVATHERAIARGGQSLILDHYLEVLLRKPGALPGATALAQARAAGSFTADPRRVLGAARAKLGDAAGTRALVEVLLLHRTWPPPTCWPGSAAALRLDNPRRTWSRSRPARPPGGRDPDPVRRAACRDVRSRRRAASAVTVPGRPAAAALGAPVRRAAHPHRRPHHQSEADQGRQTVMAPASSHRAGRGRGDRGRLPDPAAADDPDRFGEIAAAAEREQLTYLGFLAELVMAECDDRTRAAPADASTTPASPDRNGSRSSTSTPTPRSTRPPSTNWPPAPGSTPATRCA